MGGKERASEQQFLPSELSGSIIHVCLWQRWKQAVVHHCLTFSSFSEEKWVTQCERKIKSKTPTSIFLHSWSFLYSTVYKHQLWNHIGCKAHHIIFLCSETEHRSAFVYSTIIKVTCSLIAFRLQLLILFQDQNSYFGRKDQDIQVDNIVDNTEPCR